MVRTRARAVGRVAIMVLVALVVGGLTQVVNPGVASAAITSPTAASTVAGRVAISENRGGANGSHLLGSCSGGYARIEVWRVNAAGQSVEQVFTHTRPNPVAGAGTDPFTVEWDSVGRPNGRYRLRSITSDRAGGLFSCGSQQAEVVRSDFLVTLQNAAVARPQLPVTHITGEALTIPLTSVVEATNAPLGGRSVTVTIPGVGAQTVTTAPDGTAAVTFALPDLPAGFLTITTSTAGDGTFFVGRDTTHTLILRARPTALAWTGAVRGDPGQTVRLEARLTDATPGSPRAGTPIAGEPVELRLAEGSLTATTDADGRAAVNATLAGHPRQEQAGASFAGNPIFAASEVGIVFFIGDDASQQSPTSHGLIGGVLGLVGGILGQPSGLLGTTLTYVDSLIPGVAVNGTFPEFPTLDALMTHLLGDTLSELLPIGAIVDAQVETILDGLSPIPTLGPIVDTLRYDWRSVYVHPDGTRELHSFDALIGVPAPLDVNSDGYADVLATLTLEPNFDDLFGLQFTPTMKVVKLPHAPEVLPLSLQAVIGGGGLITVGGGEGSLRFGYDSRTSSAPDALTASLIVGDGGFTVDVSTRGGHDLAITGALVGGSVGLPIGSFDEPDAPTLDDPAEPGEVGDGELRFGIGFSPVPSHTVIGLGFGGGSADLGVSFRTNAPSVISVDFVQDGGADEVFVLNAVFDDVDGALDLVLSGGESAEDSVAPELGLELVADHGLDRLAISARALSGGQVTTDLLLSLTDAPNQISFGVGSDGSLGLTANEPIGVMEAGFSSGGAIAQLEDPAYLYMQTTDDFQSAAIRLLGVSSMTADLSDSLGLTLQMAPGPLRAKVDSGGLGLDARIHDAPGTFNIGLAANGAFLIEASSPIDLITLTLHDDSGALLGATDVDVRIERVPRSLAVTLVGEQIEFDAGGDVVGLLEMVASSGPTASIPAGVDGLRLTLNDDEFVLAARVHGLRNITANLDLGAPEFAIDTVAQAVFDLDLNVAGLEVSGVIDRLMPGMRMSVAANELGELTGMIYEASLPSNSISFDIPGFAQFTASDPLPARLELGLQGSAMRVAASEHFTLNLGADIEGITATITNLRVRVMEFAGGLTGENPDGSIPMYFNTTEVTEACPDGCTYPILAGTLALGPIELSGLEVTVRWTPAGFAANDATVNLLIGDELIPSVTNVGQTGLIHCAPGTSLIADTLINISMTNALCAHSTPMGDIRVVSLAAPAAVEAGTPVTHVFTARNFGPGVASAFRIDATHDETLGDPVVACGTGGVAAVAPGSAACTYAGNTAANTNRVMTLTWPTDTETPSGTTVSASYVASSNSAGEQATASASTGVYPTVAELVVLDVDAPAAVVAGSGDIVHRVTFRNNGPSPAPNLRVDADDNGALSAPSVACSDDGAVQGTGCAWAGDTGAGAERWIELTWAVPAGTPDSTLSVDYDATSDAPALDATVTAETEVADEVADLEIVDETGPARILPGEELVLTVTGRNNGPSAADDFRLLADYDRRLGFPSSVVCSDGGVATVSVVVDRARCRYDGPTAAGEERSMELTFTVPLELPLGSEFDVRYSVTSDTPGAADEATRSVLVAEPVRADMEIVSTTAPAVWASGANLVHRVDARNAGPEPATNMQLVATLPASPAPTPAVACSTGGVGSVINGGTQARCLWSGNTAAGTARFLQLTWTSANVGTAGVGFVFDVTYEASSETDGATAAAATSTEIAAAVANMSITGGTGPATVLTNASLTHSVNAQRTGPSAATNMRIVGTFDESLGAPTTVTCSSGASPTAPAPNQRQCQWGSTAGTTTRSLTLTWSAAVVGTAAPGTVVETHFVVSSDTPGSPAEVLRSTEVVLAEAVMQILGVIAPEELVIGSGNLVHRVDAQNNGPLAVNPMRIDADHDGSLGNPIVTCSSGGTATASVGGDSLARCQWGSTSGGADPRWMQLTWIVPGSASPASFTVAYSATSTQATVVPDTATATTELVAAPPPEDP